MIQRGHIQGHCFVCKSALCFDNFECGHVVSLYHNGDTQLDNLEPICRMCNGDMSIMNLYEYKRIYEKMCNNDNDHNENNYNHES